MLTPRTTESTTVSLSSVGPDATNLHRYHNKTGPTDLSWDQYILNYIIYTEQGAYL